MIEYEGVTFAFVVMGWLGLVCAMRINSTLQVAAIYTGVNAAWVMTHPLSAVPAQRIFGELLALQAFLAMAIGCIFVGWSREAARAFGRLLWFATALSILASWIFESDIPANWWTAGLITNPSMNAAMMVVLLPFAVWGQGARVQALSVAVTIAVVAMSRSLTPVLAMLVLAVTYVWTLREKKKETSSPLLVVARYLWLSYLP